MSDINRPARPARRFSALKPPVRPAKPHDREPSSVAEAAPPSSAERPQKASDEARIAKVMARAGLCSRRDAEAWIEAGRVAVNGAVITSPALNVGPADDVTVDGYPIDKPERTRLFLFHKARGLVTTARDPEGRPTVFDALPKDLPRLVTIGRLDINTEGLMLLTNDGGLARLLELPSTGWIRRYRVRANGSIDQARLDALGKGITIDGVAYAGIAAKLDRVQGANVWMTMGLKEGKNREIKRVLEHLGLGVTRLIRISFGPFQLGELADNAVEEVRTRVLRDQLGSALARQAGVDFEGPVEPVPAPPAAPPRERADDQGPRRKTRRTATEDRRGRTVTVERISSDRAAPDRADRNRERGTPARAPRGESRPASAEVRGPRPRTARQADQDWSVAVDHSGPGRPSGPARRDARPTGRDRGPAGPDSRSGQEGRTRSERPAPRDRSRPPQGSGKREGSAPNGRSEREERPRGERPAPRDRSRPPQGSGRPGGKDRPGGKGGGAKGRPRG